MPPAATTPTPHSPPQPSAVCACAWGLSPPTAHRPHATALQRTRARGLRCALWPPPAAAPSPVRTSLPSPTAPQRSRAPHTPAQRRAPQPPRARSRLRAPPPPRAPPAASPTAARRTAVLPQPLQRSDRCTPHARGGCRHTPPLPPRWGWGCEGTARTAPHACAPPDGQHALWGV